MLQVTEEMQIILINVKIRNSIAWNSPAALAARRASWTEEAKVWMKEKNAKSGHLQVSWAKTNAVDQNLQCGYLVCTTSAVLS